MAEQFFNIPRSVFLVLLQVFTVHNYAKVNIILKNSVGSRVTRDRCYDFKNIFAEKFSEKIGVFESIQS
jgi:hypothetical protein